MALFRNNAPAAADTSVRQEWQSGLAGVNVTVLRRINQILMLVALGFGAAAIYKASNAGPRPEIREVVPKPTLSAFSDVESLQPARYYLQRVSERNIFKPMLRDDDAPTDVEDDPRTKLEEFARDLEVQGIAWGRPDVVMAFDKSRGSVLFLREGQSIGKSQVEVREVGPDKVVLGLEDAEIELFTRRTYEIKKQQE